MYLKCSNLNAQPVGTPTSTYPSQTGLLDQKEEVRVEDFFPFFHLA